MIENPLYKLLSHLKIHHINRSFQKSLSVLPHIFFFLSNPFYSSDITQIRLDGRLDSDANPDQSSPILSLTKDIFNFFTIYIACERRFCTLPHSYTPNHSLVNMPRLIIITLAANVSEWLLEFIHPILYLL